MNTEPYCVAMTLPSRISLRDCICGDNSEPNAAVAMRHPPPLDLSNAIISTVYLPLPSNTILMTEVFAVLLSL